MKAASDEGLDKFQIVLEAKKKEEYFEAYDEYMTGIRRVSMTVENMIKVVVVIMIMQFINKFRRVTIQVTDDA